MHTMRLKMIGLLAIPAVTLLTVGFAIGYAWAQQDDENAFKSEPIDLESFDSEPFPVLPLGDDRLFDDVDIGFFLEEETENKRILLAAEFDLADWATRDPGRPEALAEISGICEGVPPPSEVFAVDAVIAEICLSARLGTDRSLEDIAATVRTILRPDDDEIDPGEMLVANAMALLRWSSRITRGTETTAYYVERLCARVPVGGYEPDSSPPFSVEYVTMDRTLMAICDDVLAGRAGDVSELAERIERELGPVVP